MVRNLFDEVLSFSVKSIPESNLYFENGIVEDDDDNNNNNDDDDDDDDDGCGVVIDVSNIESTVSDISKSGKFRDCGRDDLGEESNMK